MVDFLIENVWLPFDPFVDHGVNVCLGSDGSGSNDTQSMLETIKGAALQANVDAGRAGAFRCRN